MLCNIKYSQTARVYWLRDIQDYSCPMITIESSSLNDKPSGNMSDI